MCSNFAVLLDLAVVLNPLFHDSCKRRFLKNLPDVVLHPAVALHLAVVLDLAVVLVDFNAEVVIEGHIRFVCRLRPHRCYHSLIFEKF